MSENLLEAFLSSFSTGNDGCLTEEQFNRMCAEPSIGFSQEMSAQLFDRLPKNKKGNVTIKDIICELSNWQGENLRNSTNRKRSGLIERENKPERLHVRTDQDVVYEVDDQITSPFLESNTSFKDFESMLNQRYPELLMSFQNLAMDIKTEIKAKKVEKDELEQSFAEERKQRRADLTRLEMELEAEYRSAESQIEEKIRKELEKKYQNLISKKEMEVNQYKDLINDIEMKQERLSRTVTANDRKSGNYDFDLDVPPTSSKEHKISAKDFKSYNIKEINDVIKNMDSDDLNLKDLLHFTLEKLESSEGELRMIHDQLDVQTNQLILREMNAEENQKIREKLESEITTIKKKLNELNDSSFSTQENESELLPSETHSSRINKHHLYPSYNKKTVKGVDSYNPFIDDQDLSEGSELHVSILDSSEEGQQPDRLFKVIMVGDSSVGKSSFLNRFCQGNFYSSYKSTIGVDFMTKNIRIDHKLYTIQLWDTAGQEKYRSIIKSFFRKSDGAIVMYDVTSQKSFWNVREWISLIEDSGDKIPIMIVGNKIDLRDNLDNISRKKTQIITHEHGSKLAKTYDADFIEVSVAKNVNVQETVIYLSKRMKLRDDQIMSQAADCIVEISGDQKSGISCCK